MGKCIDCGIESSWDSIIGGFYCGVCDVGKSLKPPTNQPPTPPYKPAKDELIVDERYVVSNNRGSSRIRYFSHYDDNNIPRFKVCKDFMHDGYQSDDSSFLEDWNKWELEKNVFKPDKDEVDYKFLLEQLTKKHDELRLNNKALVVDNKRLERDSCKYIKVEAEQTKEYAQQLRQIAMLEIKLETLKLTNYKKELYIAIVKGMAQRESESSGVTEMWHNFFLNDFDKRFGKESK